MCDIFDILGRKTAAASFQNLPETKEVEAVIAED